MIQLSAELLALSAEPALLVKGGKILFANEAACLLLGQDCREKSFRGLLGKEIAGMQAPAFVGETELAGRRVLLRIRTMDGMRVVFLTPAAVENELIGDAFLYSLRSELMQLGASISMLQSLLPPGNAQANDALFGMIRSHYRVNRTLQNLSVIRGVEQGGLFFLPQPLNLSLLLRELLDSARLYLPEPAISLSVPEKLMLQGDPELLQGLVLNLLSNCLCHAGGCTRVHVTLHGAGEQVILSVDDDGCGIPGEQLHTVLERYRHSGSLSEAAKGPGLGLTAAREVARLHGGTLLLESREGVGTAVRVSLNRAPRPLTPLRVVPADYDRSYDTILTGLAPCLPPEAFAELNG